MTWEEYRKEVSRTMPRELTGKLALATYALGLVGEAVEVQEARHEDLTKELGDVMWYVAALQNLTGASLVHAEVFIARPRYHTLALPAAAAAVSEYVKKHVGHGHEFSPSALGGMLLDVVMTAVTCLPTGNTLHDCCLGNVQKLRLRYPDGFSAERSQNRQEGDA